MKKAAVMKAVSQTVPASGEAREALRTKGQFWTPEWLAAIMTHWVLANNPDSLFDPAVGPGTFFLSAKMNGYTGGLSGYELDPDTLLLAREFGLSESDLRNVEVADFIRADVKFTYRSIISNPPYIRHHRLSLEQKIELRALSNQVLGFPIDGRTGLHLYFLLKCLSILEPNGRLAFLLPADVCEGVSSKAVWSEIARKYRIEAVMTFESGASPFPKVDTNAMVFLISNARSRSHIRWMRIKKADSSDIYSALSAKIEMHSETVYAVNRITEEAISTGLSRMPLVASEDALPLRELASVMRGIATGANEFFFLTSAQMADKGLDSKFFKRAIGRTRDCCAAVLDKCLLDQLDESGRPTWLLSLDGQLQKELPPSLLSYLEYGQELGLSERSLIKTRRPWYRMEKRSIPPILFAYLGRRNCRFILNVGDALPLTGFLCVYPDAGVNAKSLWQALNHPDTISGLATVGKSYGGGAIKVEPRQLDELRIPAHVLKEFNLSVSSKEQLLLLEESPPYEATVFPATDNNKKHKATPRRK